jgi:large conductance mechanosensitive channel
VQDGHRDERDGSSITFPQAPTIRMWKEFKTFLIKDNVIGLAIAFILGVSLNSVVKSIVDDLFMPVINLITGAAGPNWQEALNIPLTAAGADGPSLRFGAFIAVLINFVIIGFVAWRLTKVFVKPPTPAPTDPTKVCGFCKSVIPAAATRCPNCTSQL